MRMIAVAALAVVLLAVRAFVGAAGADPMPQAMLSFGLLVIAGYLAGCYAAKIGLPQITGYLIAGILCGPYVFEFVSREAVLELTAIDDLALALIAFTAGGEIRLSTLRKRGGGIMAVAAAQAFATLIIVSGGVFVALRFFDPFGLPPQADAAVAVLCGVIAQANSPATAIAVIVESRASGPVTDIVLGVTVLKDVIVMLFFSLALAIVAALSAQTISADTSLGWAFVEIAGSIVAGLAAGAVIAAVLRFVRHELVLFIITVSLLIVFLSRYGHLHFVLVCIMAGFVVENWTGMGHRLVEAIERTSMAVYIVFFALAGASINLTALAQVWPVAVALVLLRAFGMGVGTWGGARLAGTDPLFRRHGWMGFLSQAGVSLGMAALVVRAFPEWGTNFRTVILSAIAIDQIIGPVTLKFLLGLAGETAEQHLIARLRPLFRKQAIGAE